MREGEYALFIKNVIEVGILLQYYWIIHFRPASQHNEVLVSGDGCLEELSADSNTMVTMCVLSKDEEEKSHNHLINKCASCHISLK